MSDDEVEALNLDVARALGHCVQESTYSQDYGIEVLDSVTGHRVEGTNYATSWADGGPIIERARIWLTARPDGTWSADVPGEPGNPDVNPNPLRGEPGHVKGVGYGETALIAAMRAFVAASEVRHRHPKLSSDVML